MEDTEDMEMVMEIMEVTEIMEDTDGAGKIFIDEQLS